MRLVSCSNCCSSGCVHSSKRAPLAVAWKGFQYSAHVFVGILVRTQIYRSPAMALSSIDECSIADLYLCVEYLQSYAIHCELVMLHAHQKFYAHLKPEFDTSVLTVLVPHPVTGLLSHVYPAGRRLACTTYLRWSFLSHQGLALLGVLLRHLQSHPLRSHLRSPCARGPPRMVI